MASYLIKVVPSVLTLFVNEAKTATIVSNVSSIKIQKPIDIANSYIDDDNNIVVEGLKLGSAFINIFGYDDNGDYLTGDTLTVNVVKNEVIETIKIYTPSIDYFKMMFPFFEYDNVLIDSNEANFETNNYEVRNNQLITDKYLSMLINECSLMMTAYINNNGYIEPSVENMGAVQPLKDYICYLVAYKLCFREAKNTDLTIRIDTERGRILEELKLVLAKRGNSSYQSVKLGGEIKKP